ncbi:MAG: hypothetical protein RL148_1466 [Planctomycetota bacterium]
MVLLLARTHFSFLTAPASPRELCEVAVLRGCDHLALTDTNGMHGLYGFAREARRLGLRTLFGVELVHRGRRLHALARDRTGYESLCALVTGLHLDPGFDLAVAAGEHCAGLWLLCSDLRLLPALAARLGGEQLFVALPPRGMTPTADLLAGEPALATPSGRKLPDPGPRWPRQQLVEAAEVLGLGLVAARDVWFARQEDHPAHQLFLAVKWNRALRPGDEGASLGGIVQAHPSMCVPERGCATDGYEDHPQAVVRARELRDACTLEFPERSPPVFPPCRLPDGTTAESHLHELARAGLRRRGLHDHPRAAERLERELAVIAQMGFAPYFLVVHDIAHLAWERGIPCVGRGSAADSLVAHALGLTDADPLRYGLLFERFLNPARTDLPDIDLDFCWRRRDELLDAVYEHFGRDHVAMIATANTCGPRAAYSEAARASGLPPDEVARRTRLLPWHGKDPVDLARCAAEAPGFFRSTLLTQASERRVLAAAQRLLDAPRHLGVHPGGIVVTPQPVVRHAPLERAQKGVVVTQYDMHCVEGLGLVKIDLLGNRALTILQDCSAMLARTGIAVPDLHTVAEDDAQTAATVRSGRTIGCFQVESPGMRTLLQQMDAHTMDHVIQAVALIRPGPAAAGMKDSFVRRARGLEPVEAAHPLLAEVFADTHGIMLYQEDVIRAAMAVAGMDAADGDRLRRRLGARTADAAALDGFVVSGLRRGMPREVLERVWDEMARFAGYSFCKAHAVTYGRIAWRCIWLKSRWPVAFLAAVLENEAGYYEQGVYVEELKRHGGRMLPACVQHGGLGFELVDVRTVRAGLRAVRGLSDRTAQAVLAARRSGGAFRSVEDFLRRVAPARDEAENLVLGGALDAFGHTRPELLWRLQVASRPEALARQRAQAGPALLPDALAPVEPAYPQLPQFSPVQRTQAELEVYGYGLDAHPVDVLWRHTRPVAGVVPCARLGECLGRAVAVHGWAVAYRRHRGGSGEPMLFVTLEDGSGIVETTLFPSVYRAHAQALQGRGPFVVHGTVEERLGGVGLRVTRVQAVQ